MEYFAWFILFFLALRTLISLVNLISKVHLPNEKPMTFPKVSLLIPARNEEAAIGRLLNRLHVRGLVKKVPRTRLWRMVILGSRR